MTKPVFVGVISILLVAACTVNRPPPQRYFDYSGADGCNPPNIGHRLGGDIGNFPPNSIEGMRAIESRQDSKCFKNWEFDLNQAKDGVVLFHDNSFQGRAVIGLSVSELPMGTLDTKVFAVEFAKLNIVKPVIIDIKNILNPSCWVTAIELARSIRSGHQVDVWFTTSSQQAKRMTGICSVIAGEFDIMLYRQGGRLCT